MKDKKNNEGKSVRKIGFWTVVRWLAIAFFILLGIIVFITPNVGFGGMIFWFLAFLWTSHFNNFTQKRGFELSSALKIVITFILFLLAIAMVSAPTQHSSATSNGQSGIPPTQQTQEKTSQQDSNISEPLTYEPVTDFTDCYERFRIELSSGDTESAKNTIVECREEARKEINNLRDLQQKAQTQEKKEFLGVQELILEAKDSYLNYAYLKITKLYPVYGDIPSMSKEQKQKVQTALISILPSAEQSLYYLYKIKTEHPTYWDDKLAKSFEIIAQDYKNRNQELNWLYDYFEGFYQKYYLQVDPNDPVIVEIVNKVARPRGGNMEEIKNALIQYVRENVNYTYDPNWKADWVQPPAFTALYEYGDCDDVSVLIASLFLRAGVENVNLCFVRDFPHLTVATKEDRGMAIWEGTCNNCIGKWWLSDLGWNVDCKQLG